MQNRKNRRSASDQPDRIDSDGLMQDSEWVLLQDSLRKMVAGESEHVHHSVLTDNILRAVRPKTGGMRSFDELWSGTLLAWFRPVVVAGILLIFLLAAYNAQKTSPVMAELTTTQRVLGLHPVTVASAYDREFDTIAE